MSRFYEMHLTVSGFKPQRAVAIEEAANEEWPFEELSNDGNELSGAGQSNLCGGEGEEEFAARLTLAVWRANGGPCEVCVEATYMEELPHEDYNFSADHPPEGWVAPPETKPKVEPPSIPEGLRK